jgi:hypothetical protein
MFTRYTLTFNDDIDLEDLQAMELRLLENPNVENVSVLSEFHQIYLEVYGEEDHTDEFSKLPGVEAVEKI